MSRRVCLILNDAFSMYRFRRGLISCLVEAGHRVHVVVPPSPEYGARLRDLGAVVVEMPMKRFIDPLADTLLLARIVWLFLSRRFDLVHTMTIKPNLYFPLFARLLGVRRIVGLVSGAGYMLGPEARERYPIVSRLVRLGLRLSFRPMHRVWFQNADDFERFVSHKICRPSQGVVIRGSGVDLIEFNPQLDSDALRERKRSELGIPRRCRLVMMGAARMVASKGVREFAEAAHALSTRYPDWYFLLVAPTDVGTPDEVHPSELAGIADKLTICSEFRTDIHELIAASDIITLPSYYPEGVPRFLLEALACGKPIVTTDHVGCRETVIDKVTGLVVPVKDSNALQGALEVLMNDEGLRARYGGAGRKLAEREYSQESVAREVMAKVYCLDELTA